MGNFTVRIQTTRKFRGFSSSRILSCDEDPNLQPLNDKPLYVATLLAQTFKKAVNGREIQSFLSLDKNARFSWRFITVCCRPIERNRLFITCILSDPIFLGAWKLPWE